MSPVNSHAPAVMGYEPMILRQRGLRVTKDLRVAAVLTPGAVLTDDIAIRIKNLVGTPMIAAEIVKVADLTPGNAVTTNDILRPTADAPGFGTYRHGLAGGTVGPFWPDIDEAVLNTADFIANDVTTLGGADFAFGTGAYPANRRVLSLTLKMVTKTLTSGITVIDPRLTFTAQTPTQTVLPSRTIDFTEGQKTISDMVWTSRCDGLPLTSADVNVLAGNTAGWIGWNHAAPSQPAGFAIYQAWVEALSVPETRLAFGSLVATTNGWLTIPMGTVAGGDTWTPIAATAYAVILYVVGDGSFSLEAVDAGVAHPDIYAAPIVLSSDNFAAGLGTTDTAAPAVVGLNGVGAPLWGQPFGEVVEEEVYQGRTIQSEITLSDAPQAATGYGSVKLVVRKASTLTSASLVVKLRRRSDDVQVGGDVTVTPNEVRGAPRQAQVVRIPMAAAAAGLGTTQHYLEISSVATQGNGWLVTTISSGTGETVYGTALGFGGGTDVVTVGGVDLLDRDVPMTMAGTRVAPAGLAVVANP